MSNSETSHRVALAWAVPVAVAVALRAYGLDWGLPDLFEEARSFFEAWEMWGWGRSTGFDPDPGFYRYPSLFFYVQLIAQAAQVGARWVLGGAEAVREVPFEYYDDRTSFLLVGRAVTAAFGAGIVAGCFALGRRLGGVVAGCVAALLAAVNGFLVDHSQNIVVDTPLMCFAVWMLWATLRIPERPTLARSLVAGALLGLATSSKYTGAFLAIPLIVAHGFAVRAAPPKKRRSVLGAMVGAGVLSVLVFAVTSPFVLLKWEVALQDILSEGVHMREGHLGAEAGLGWWVYLRALGERVLGWPGLLSSLAGIALLARRRMTDAIVLGAFLLVYLGVIGSWQMRADRYAGPLVPVLLALAAVPIAVLLPRRRALAAGLAALLVVWGAMGLPEVWARHRTDNRTLAREWIESKIPAGAFLVMEPWGPDLLEPIDVYDLPAGMRSDFLDRTSRKLYAVQALPLVPGRPELTAMFYDLSVHEDADLVVLSSDVGDRYREDPQRFAPHLAFYEHLAASAPLLADFGPEQGTGPRIMIYAPDPKPDIFGRRAPVGPKELPRSELELEARKSIWYGKLGLNYETFGHTRAAIRCYELAASTDAWAAGVLSRASRGVGRCYLKLDDAAGAVRSIEKMLAVCPYPEEAARMEPLLRQLRRTAGRAEPGPPPSGGSGPVESGPDGPGPGESGATEATEPMESSAG